MNAYSYRPRVTTMLWAGGFFALACAFFVHRALSNDRGLVINGVIEFGADGATAFFWALAAVSAAFVLAAVGLTVLGLARGPQLMLGDDAITVPSGLLRMTYRNLRYDEISDIIEQKVSGQTMATLRGATGSLTILKSHFASDSEYAACLAQVRQRCAGVQARGGR